MEKKGKKERNLWKYSSIILAFFLMISIILNIFFFFTKEEKIETILDENIVFFGDSLTATYNVEEFFPNHHVVNSGISGDKTTDLLERMEKDVYAYNPSKVVLLIGINDLNHDRDPKEVVENIQKIVSQIKINRKNAEIYVESLYPINRDTMNNEEYYFNSNISNDTLKEINQSIEKLCKENEITYIDVFSTLLDDDGDLKEVYTKEGLHLNDLGFFKVTMKLGEYIK